MTRKLRARFGRYLIAKGIKLAGEPERKTEVKKALGKPLDAVVEATNEDEQWQPKQQGNVVIAEPEIVRYARKHNIL